MGQWKYDAIIANLPFYIMGECSTFIMFASLELAQTRQLENIILKNEAKDAEEHSEGEDDAVEDSKTDIADDEDILTMGEFVRGEPMTAVMGNLAMTLLLWGIKTGVLQMGIGQVQEE